MFRVGVSRLGFRLPGSWLTSQPLLKVKLLAPLLIVHIETRKVKALRVNQKNGKGL